MRIGVYADWLGLSHPTLLGYLHSRRTRSNEVFEFEFDLSALNHRALQGLQLDPHLTCLEGAQFPIRPRKTFGVFADSSPDRWGRQLMNRRFEREMRAGIHAAGSRLYESDYLLGVHDLYRVGGLRYKVEEQGDFLDQRQDMLAPPFAKIGELERASRAIEQDIHNQDIAGADWLRMLIAPGGSLGGARPKASVVDEQGHLYIAKFPSVRDDYDVGGWEMVVNTLARACGLDVAYARIHQFVSPYHCFMVKRFDRTLDGQRLHFASAMTMTGHLDGEDATQGVSYLEIAEVILKIGSTPDNDLRELWSRIVFNMLVSNSDDHLRNHGFIWYPGEGWRLSAAYDLNPVPTASGLALNISEFDNALELDLVRSVAPYFRIEDTEAKKIIQKLCRVVQQWRRVATQLKLSQREQAQMENAFRLAEKEISFY